MEAELIRQARQQDRDAFDTLMERYREVVFRLAYLLLGDAHDADDITQETFIRAFAAIHTYDPSRPLRPWLLGIAANLVRNRKRSIARYLAALQRFAVYSPPESDPDAETLTLQQARALRLWNVVKRLKSEEQELIYLRYFLELSVDETAAALNVAPGTVKSRTHRTLGRLKGLIQRYDPELEFDA